MVQTRRAEDTFFGACQCGTDNALAAVLAPEGVQAVGGQHQGDGVGSASIRPLIEERGGIGDCPR